MSEQEQGNPAEDAPQTDTPPVEQGESGEQRTFTQADVDRLIKDRLKREREKYADYDELTDKAKKWAQHEEAQKSEIERERERAAALERASAEQAATYKANLVRMEARVQAAQMGFKNPDDAYLLADLSEVEVGESGEVGGVDEALKVLAKAKPYLIDTEKPRPTAPGTDAGQGNQPERGQAALTAGEQAALAIAQRYGYQIDPDAASKRKAGRS